MAKSGARVLSLGGLLTFGVFLALAAYVYLRVQVFIPLGHWYSWFPFKGTYGNYQFALGLDYDHVLELAGPLSFVGLFAFALGRNSGLPRRKRLELSLALPLLFFGVLVALIVYTEIHLLWGELWYGLKFANWNPSGFPWGNERVTYNSCLLHGSDYDPIEGGHCWFLNYDELLYMAVGCVVVSRLLRWEATRQKRPRQD